MNRLLFLTLLLATSAVLSLEVPTTHAQAPCDPTTMSCAPVNCDPNEGPCQPGTTAPNGTTNVGTQATSGFVPLAPIPGLTAARDGGALSVIDSKSLADFFNNLYLYVIGLAAAVAVIQIIYAGIELALNQGSVSGLMESKGRISRSIQGIILIFSPVLVFSLINPTILNLDLNLQPLDTKSGTSSSGGGGANKEPDLSQFECTTLRSGTHLEVAKCPAKALATAYVCKNTSLKLRQSFVDMPCRSFDPNTKTCNDQVQVECIKQPPLKLIYYFTEDIGWIYNSQNAPATIIPRDTAIEQTFTQECAVDGGQFQKLRGATVSCPPDANLPPYDPLKVSGVVCQTFELNCRAK